MKLKKVIKRADKEKGVVLVAGPPNKAALVNHWRKVGPELLWLVEQSQTAVSSSCPHCKFDEAEGVLLDHCPDCQRRIVTALWGILCEEKGLETYNAVLEVTEI